MKKIFIAVFALLSLAPLNALTLDEVLANKILSEEIKGILQEQTVKSKTPYNVAGLLYIGPARLVKTNNSKQFALLQNKGYITYQLLTNNNFNTFSIEIREEAINNNPDPHRSNIYNVFFKLFKDKILIAEHFAGTIELRNAGTSDEGTFYTNLAVNAIYFKEKFYVADKEPYTCGQQIDIKNSELIKPTYETRTYIKHSPDCKDPHHCSCPVGTEIVRLEYTPVKISFPIQTDSCKKDKNCKCPVYITSQN